MPSLSLFRAFERRRKRYLVWAFASLALLLISLILRYVPRLSDALSGKPPYMEAFATLMARQVAEASHAEYPVLVVRQEVLDCHNVSQEATAGYENLYYVLAFSEQARSLCLTVFGQVPADSKAQNTTTLAPTMGKNYGRPFSAAVRTVPLERRLTVFTESYLSALHWRIRVNPGLSMAAGTEQRFRSPSATALNSEDVNLSLSLSDIRTEVARRHNAINRGLFGLMVLTTIALLTSLIKLAILRRACAASCRTCSVDLPLWEFLIRDLRVTGERAVEGYYQRQQQVRREQIHRRTKEELQRGLEALLSTVRDERQRQLVEGCLQKGDPDDMRSLLDQLHAQATQKTPEERLHLLLEGFKEYCTGGVSGLQQGSL